jgi:hypothetical protein
MASFAELDQNNIVKRVISVSDNELLENGVMLESKGIQFCKSLFGQNTTWVQTSFTTRNTYAGIGFTYDSNKDIFIPIQPYPSWSLDDNGNWQSPIAKPQDNNLYKWNETILNWEIYTLPLDNS